MSMNWNGWNPILSGTPAQGWQCPQCRVIYAPTVPSCRCMISGGYPLTFTTGGTSISMQDNTIKINSAGAIMNIYETGEIEYRTEKKDEPK